VAAVQLERVRKIYGGMHIRGRGMRASTWPTRSSSCSSVPSGSGKIDAVADHRGP